MVVTLISPGRPPMFAFDPMTDPPEVLAEMCRTWTERRHPLCQSRQFMNVFPCPVPDGYCLDCHCAASSALSAYQQRFEDQ